jgi:hypothetical protein
MTIGTQVFTPSTVWSTENRYQASVDVDIIISSALDGMQPFPDVRYMLTSSGDPPSISPQAGHPIKKDQVIPMRLHAGEYVWFAKLGPPQARRRVTLTWAD